MTKGPQEPRLYGPAEREIPEAVAKRPSIFAIDAFVTETLGASLSQFHCMWRSGSQLVRCSCYAYAPGYYNAQPRFRSYVGPRATATRRAPSMVSAIAAGVGEAALTSNAGTEKLGVSRIFVEATRARRWLPTVSYLNKKPCIISIRTRTHRAASFRNAATDASQESENLACRPEG